MRRVILDPLRFVLTLIILRLTRHCCVFDQIRDANSIAPERRGNPQSGRLQRLEVVDHGPALGCVLDAGVGHRRARDHAVRSVQEAVEVGLVPGQAGSFMASE